MDFDGFLKNALVSSDAKADAFAKAAADKVHCAWRIRKIGGLDTVEYAVRGNFDPVFTLLATARGASTDIQTNFDPGLMGEDGKGIQAHLVSIAGRRTPPIVITKVAKPGFAGTAYRLLSLERAEMGQALAAAFALPKATNPVTDMRHENATAKVEGVKDYSKAGTHTLPRLYMAAVFTILGNHQKIPQGSKIEREGVVAMIVDRRGNITSWGLKNQDVDCWHGETISTIRLGGVLPPGAVVFSSLKPCHMCSGVLHAASGGKVKVYWGMDDPKVKGETILETQHLGGTLGANKAADLKAKSLLLTPKDPTSDVAVDLLGSFVKSGLPSAINFAAQAGGDASKTFGTVEKRLTDKLAKYRKAATDKTAANANVAAVLEYLDGFLRNQAKVIG